MKHRGEIHRGLKSLIDSSQVRTRSNWKSLRERSWMSLVSMRQHGKQSPNHQNNFVVPMGNYSKISCIYCVMVMPILIQCYQIVIILLQFIQTIFIQIWNQLTQRFCGSQWIKWIRNLKMNSKISLLKLKESWFKWFQDSMRWWLCEPPNRTVQRDDLRIAQLRGDWSQRSSTIIPSSVHIKLMKHPISMVPMWKFPISTMVSFRVFFFF